MSAQNVVQTTLQSCCHEFWQYDAVYSQDALSSLRASVSSAPENLPAHDRLSPDIDTQSGEFAFFDYDEEGNAVDVGLGPVIEVHVGEEFFPHPAYEICTPASRNINVGDDADYMPFAPFADDPRFNLEPYKDNHSNFSWQFLRPDPDLEMVAIEAAHRLVEKVGLSPNLLFKAGFFPTQHPAYPTDPFPRLVKLAQQRDFPVPLPPNWTLALPHSPEHSRSGPLEIVETLIGSFCHNLSCLTGYCTTHLDSIPPPIPPPLTITKEALLLSADKPCGKDCFITPITIRDVNSGAVWTESDKQLLGVVLLHSPNTLSCDLAIICRKPCFEVFKYRNEYFDSIPPEKDKNPRRKMGKSTLIFEDNDANKHAPNEPCSHAGPCGALSNCPCFKNNAHCTNSCRCDPKCPRQFQGCNCRWTSKSRICTKGRCTCRMQLRECDPRICHVDLPRELCMLGSELEPPCCNMAIQLGLHKRTKVVRSNWGLGLFIQEDAIPGDLIVEYTGELVYEPSTITRDIVASHRERLYLFQLNNLTFVDSALVGNEARYINHNFNSNCEASILNVMGEHRIGFYATQVIPSGTEIVLNYGPEFFKHPTHDARTEAETETNSRKAGEKESKRKKGRPKNPKKRERVDEEVVMTDVSYQPPATASDSPLE